MGGIFQPVGQFSSQSFGGGVPKISDWANKPSSPSDGDTLIFQGGSPDLLLEYQSSASNWVAVSTRDQWVSLPLVKNGVVNNDLFPVETDNGIGSITVNGNGNIETTTNGANQLYRLQADFLVPTSAGALRSTRTTSETTLGSGFSLEYEGLLEDTFDSNVDGSMGGVSADNTNARQDYYDGGSITYWTSFGISHGDDVVSQVSSHDSADYFHHEAWLTVVNGTDQDWNSRVRGAGDTIDGLLRPYIWWDTDGSYDGEHTYELKKLELKI